MKAKLKIALLTLLGFSTAACCTTKKTNGKESDSEGKQIERDSVDTRIMLMYGVPFPNGSTTAPLSDEETQEAQNRIQEIRTEEMAEAPEIVGGPALFPDGSQAVPLKAEAEDIKVNKGPALFPDGRAAGALSEEEAAKKVAEMEAKAEAAEQK